MTSSSSNHSQERIPTGLILSISTFSTCEIADALVALNCPSGGYLPDLNLYSPDSKSKTPFKLCGEAFTVQMVHANDPEASRPKEHFVDAAEPGTVIVISCPPNTKNAVWGGLMTTRAQFLGIKGVVINGRCRDLAEHREVGFPVFARSHSVLGQGTFTRPSVLQEPITIHPLDEGLSQASGTQRLAPVTIQPYDIIVGDEDGVVVVPKTLLEQVIKDCAKNADIDKKCLADLKAGRSIKDTFAEHRGK
ncbi:ribonuclease E inhibitor RraA/Dimethylmenaquinone methyltransferase [Melampsora americana]|nr:ribonuclease E inhibitor RraA/Dimethylmenaquinone methyltransferase [Melampsora americana]